MDKKIVLEVKRHHETNREEFQSISDAAKSALLQLEYDASFPHRILENGTVVWQFQAIDRVDSELIGLTDEKKSPVIR